MRKALAALVLLLAGCAASAPGTYEVIQPAANAGELHVRVTLRPDGVGVLSGAFSGRPSRYLAEGSWKQEDKRVVLSLGGPRPERLVFDLSGDQLIAREWDRAIWGETGPGVLFRIR